MVNEIQHNVLIYDSQIKDSSNFVYPEINFKTTVIYEVIRIINSVPLFLEDHLRRLCNSAKLENFKVLVKKIEIINSINQLVKETRVENGNIKIEIHFSKGVQSLFMVYFIKHYYPTPQQYENGVNVLLYQNERKNPNAKTLNINYKKNIESVIKDNMVYEALLVNKKGFITEGSKSNVFFVKNHFLYTAPEKLILPGITRKYVLDIAKNMQVEIKEQCVNIKNIDDFDSAFITGTSPKVLPIQIVNGKIFDVKNVLLRKIIEEFNNMVDNYIFSNS